MTRAYWSLRHFIWSVREWLFVREAMRLLRHSGTVYVHPLTGGPARAVLRRLDDTSEDDLSHSHVEGRRTVGWRPRSSARQDAS